MAAEITQMQAAEYIRKTENAKNFAMARDFWQVVALDHRRKIRADLEAGAKSFGVSVLDFAEHIAEIAADRCARGGASADVFTGVASFMAGLDIAREIVARTSTPAEVATDGR